MPSSVPLLESHENFDQAILRPRLGYVPLYILSTLEGWEHPFETYSRVF